MSSKKKVGVNIGELRQLVEEIDGKNIKKTDENMDALSPEGARRLLNELQVHQMELEMQNEELRRTKDELAASRDLYFNFYNIAPVGYLTLNENSLIVEANHTMATWLGIAKNQLLGQPLTRFICREDQDHYYLCNKQLFATGKAKPCELRLVNKSGEQFWIRMEVTVIFGDNDTAHCHAVINDITERKQAEKVVKTSEEKYRILAENIKDVIWVLDTETLYFRYVSPSVYYLRGYTPEEIMVEPVDAALSQEQRDSIIDIIREKSAKLLSGQIDEDMYFVGETEQPRKDGAMVWTEVTTSYYMNKETGHVEVRGVSRDISERKRAEEAQIRGAKIQSILREITEAAILTDSLQELYKTIHMLMKKVLTSKNLFIALLNENKKRIEIPYVDEEIKSIPCSRPVGNGLTEYVMRLGQAMHLRREDLVQLYGSGEVEDLHVRPITEWMGAPLIDYRGRVFGVIAQLLTEEAISFQKEELELLQIIAAQISMVIKRKQAEETLLRNAEIQTVLHEISEAAVLTPSMDELYRAVHRLLGRVLPAKLFHINLLDEAINEIVVPFMADDMNFIPSHRPIGKGMTEYIMGLGRTTYITPTDVVNLR